MLDENQENTEDQNKATPEENEVTPIETSKAEKVEEVVEAVEKVEEEKVATDKAVEEIEEKVAEEAEKLSAYMNFTVGRAYGGTNIQTQKNEIFNGLDMLVATPGRLLDLLLCGALKPKNLKKLVLTIRVNKV